jgi:hypothetical protein
MKRYRGRGFWALDLSWQVLTAILSWNVAV